MRRMATILGTAAVVFMATSVCAQAPNFAGSWVVDAKKPATVAPAAPAGGGGRGGGRGGGGPMTIAQDAKTLTVTRTTQAGETKTVYNLDGSDSKNMMAGRGGAEPTEVVSKAKWDGAKLVIRSANGQTTTYSLDGAWLVQATTRPGREGGPATTVSVYYKKAQ